jgi:hypothetical protein
MEPIQVSPQPARMAIPSPRRSAPSNLGARALILFGRRAPQQSHPSSLAALRGGSAPPRHHLR